MTALCGHQVMGVSEQLSHNCPCHSGVGFRYCASDGVCSAFLCLEVVCELAAAERWLCVLAAVLSVLCLRMLSLIQEEAVDTGKCDCKTADFGKVGQDLCLKAHSEPHCLSVVRSHCVCAFTIPGWFI